MIKIVQFSDTHFDRPFELTTPEAFSSRYAELKSSFSSVMQYINEQDVDLALIPGDLFDAQTLSSDTLSFIKREIASCQKCKFFISPGDADAYGEDSPYNSAWPTNVHIFKEENLTHVHLEELNCDIYGLAATRSTSADNLLDSIEPFALNRTNILVIHGDTESTPDSVYGLSPEILRQSGFDYIALGHHHSATNPSTAANYAYSGSISGHGFNECGNKGVLAVFIDNGKATIKDVKFSNHSYIKLSVDISAVERYGNTDEAIARLIDAKIAEMLGRRTKIESISVMVTLVGHINETLKFKLSNVRKLVENATDPVLKDETAVIPSSRHLAGIKDGIAAEAQARGCPELTERAMKMITSKLDTRERK